MSVGTSGNSTSIPARELTLPGGGDNSYEANNNDDGRLSPSANAISEASKEETMWTNIMKQIFTGLVASLVAEVITLPIETIKVMQQASGVPATQIAKDIFLTKGIKGFFHGTGARLFQTVMSQVGFFCWQALLKDSSVFHRRNPSMFHSLIVNVLSQQINRFFTLPLEVVANATQASLDSGGATAVIKKVYNEDGLAGFWKGLAISLVLALNPALMFTLVEKLQVVVRKILIQEHVSASQMFQISALAKTIATLVTYPLIRAKVVMQTSRRSSSSTTVGILSKIYGEEGFLGWYNGVWVLSYKTVLFNALMMAVKTRVTNFYYEYVANYIGGASLQGLFLSRSLKTMDSPVCASEMEEAKKTYRAKVELLSEETPWEAREEGKEVLYLPGAWNFLHPSHQHLLQTATSRPNCHVIVGIHDDQTRREHHATECQEAFDQRVDRIRKYRGVGSMLLRAPWGINKNFMKSLGIAKVLAGRRCSADPRDPYSIPASRNMFEFVEDPYDGMWRKMVRLIMSNSDEGTMGTISTPSSTFRAFNTSKRKTLYRRDTAGNEKVSGEGKGLLRKASWYFLYQLTDPDSRPPEFSKRERDLAKAERRRSDNFGNNLNQSSASKDSS